MTERNERLLALPLSDGESWTTRGGGGDNGVYPMNGWMHGKLRETGESAREKEELKDAIASTS